MDKATKTYLKLMKNRHQPSWEILIREARNKHLQEIKKKNNELLREQFITAPD